MRTLAKPLVVLALTLWTAVGAADLSVEQTARVMHELTEGVPRTDPVTSAEVLKMMARIPGRPGDPQSKPYSWDKKKGAPDVAEAIAAAAPTRGWAARMVVYALHESGVQLSPGISGDGGKSKGPFQLQAIDEPVACDPLKAARIWLQFAERSEAHCILLPEAERMAELVSGSCGKGRRLARRREVLVLAALHAS